MLDHVEGTDQVVMALGHSRELGERRAHDLATETPFRVGAHFVIELERVNMAEDAEHRKIVARAAPDLENGRSRGWPDQAPDQGREHLAASPVPPVAVVELSHAIVDDAFHQPKTSWRLRPKVASGVIKIAGISGHQVGPCTSGPVSTQVNASLRMKPDPWTRKNLIFIARSSRLP